MTMVEAEKRFPCGKVEQEINTYTPVVLIGRLVLCSVAILAIWHVRQGVPWVQQLIDYLLVIFALWRIYHLGDAVAFVCEKGIVIRRRPVDMMERMGYLWHGEQPYVFLPYKHIMGFTSDWQEIHVTTADGGIMIVIVDLQFVRYRDKVKFLELIEDRSGTGTDD